MVLDEYSPDLDPANDPIGHFWAESIREGGSSVHRSPRFDLDGSTRDDDGDLLHRLVSNSNSIPCLQYYYVPHLEPQYR